MFPKPKPTDSLPIHGEMTSALWFLTGFFAVILAGFAKIAIADHFNQE